MGGGLTSRPFHNWGRHWRSGRRPRPTRCRPGRLARAPRACPEDSAPSLHLEMNSGSLRYVNSLAAYVPCQLCQQQLGRVRATFKAKQILYTYGLLDCLPQQWMAAHIIHTWRDSQRGSPERVARAPQATMWVPPSY